MSVKRRLRPLINFAAHSGGVLGWREQAMTRGTTILTYHRVLDDACCEDYPFDSLVMPVTAFREQMNWVSEHREALTIADALKTPKAGTRGARPQVCICFDDGYDDNYHLAAPILDECGIRGTFFVTAGIIESREPLWFDLAALQWPLVGREKILQRVIEVLGRDLRILNISSALEWVRFLKACEPSARARLLQPEGVSNADLAKIQLMTVSQVQDLHNRGHEIGSHTLTHPLLPQLEESDLKNELLGSRVRLRKWLGEEVVGIAYPNGDCDDRVIAAALAAGYQYGCTTLTGLNCDVQDAMRLRRIHVCPSRVTASGRHDELGFRAEISRLYVRSN